MSDKKEFSVADAIAQSKEQLVPFLVDSLLFNPETQKEMFVMYPPTEDEDGTVTFICASDPEDEVYIAHTFMSVYVNKSDLIFAPKEPEVSPLISDQNSGKLVGLDGQPLN